MARQLVESLVGDFDPEEYQNEYRNDLRAMLEDKLEGKEIVAPEPPKEAAVVDLMEALKQSVAAGAEGQARSREAEGRRPQKAPRRSAQAPLVPASSSDRRR
jgi:DNA end-binding protein Ku